MVVCPVCRSSKAKVMPELIQVTSTGTDIGSRAFKYKKDDKDVTFNTNLHVCCNCGFIMEFIPPEKLREITDEDDE